MITRNASWIAVKNNVQDYPFGVLIVNFNLSGRFFSNEVLYPKRIYEIQAEEGCLIYPPPINVWECAASEGTKALRWPMQDLLKPALSPKRSIQTAILMLGNGGSEKPKTCEVPHSACPSKAVRKYGVFGAPV